MSMDAISIGDSWGKVVAGGGTPWPDLLGITNLCISGSTAQEWAGNKENWLADAQALKPETVIISLMGNDARHALEDGKITWAEKIAALTSMRAVVTAMMPARIIVLLYADPFAGTNAMTKVAVPKLNQAIEFSLVGLPTEYVRCYKFLGSEHFNVATDPLHPNQDGHQAIAKRIKGML